MISTETLTYCYAAGLALLLNVLATVALVTNVAADYIAPHVPFVVVCNLASYAAVLGALRRP